VWSPAEPEPRAFRPGETSDPWSLALPYGISSKTPVSRFFLTFCQLKYRPFIAM